MKTLVIGAALLLATAMVVLLVLPERSTARGAPAPAPVLEPRGDDPRVAALERRTDELAMEIGALRDELDQLALRRIPLVEAPEPAPVPGPAASTEERGPAWYLGQYVASFANGGTGSEYFRLAVEAYAPELVRELGAIALDGRAHPMLRQKLVAMLGDGRLAGHGPAIDVLLRVVTLRGEAALTSAALGALQAIGGTQGARSLAALFPSIEGDECRVKALQVLAALSGSEANAVLAALWPRAASDSDRAGLVAFTQPNEGVHSLQLFTQASWATSTDVRLAAAKAIGGFRFPGFTDLIGEWIQRETDANVRQALGAARATLTQAPRWSAACAAGPPDAQSMEDDPKAWASQQADMGLQWLELAYDPPLRASGVRIFEVCVAGAVTQVAGIDERGNAHTLWSGADPTQTPGVFELEFASTSYRVRALKLTLDTNRRPGWSEIDAVELTGPDGRAWASSARASSSYGQ